jgi:hypothetical protein
MPVTPQTPPVTTPVLERITQNIVETLQTITTENGYSVDATVSQPNPGVGYPDKDGAIMVGTGEADVEAPPQQYVQWLQHFDILTLVSISEKAADPNLETLRNKRWAEIVWALAHDSDGNRHQTTRGGLAEDTLVLGATISPAQPDAHEAAIIVHIAVRYRTPLNNPFASIYD